MSIFKLPDLGEGLQDAEIREWLVKAGDTVGVDQPLLSVETAKAVVEVSSPQAGRIIKLHGAAGDIIGVGAALVEFAGEATPETTAQVAIRDDGVVVGATKTSDEVITEQTANVGTAAGIKVMPAVRALAHRLDVDLGIVTPSGSDGIITVADVQRVHRILTEIGPLEKLHGPRRTMAQIMSRARGEVTPATLTDDAVLTAWSGNLDITLCLIQALIAGCRAEPSLNAWYDHAEIGRRVLNKINLGVAVDTPEGQLVCVLKDVGHRDATSLRRGLEKMKAEARAHSVPLKELRGHTITLSNFGRFGGRYATPVVVPPTVAIVAAGSLREAVVPIDGRPAVAPVLPLSLTFDHRCVTGGEAARFLAAMIKDLQQAN